MSQTIVNRISEAMFTSYVNDPDIDYVFRDYQASIDYEMRRGHLSIAEYDNLYWLNEYMYQAHKED